jgi:cation:H+ antiporter
MPMMIVATLLYFVIIWDKEITHWEGWLLVIFYIFFLGKLFGLL